MTFRFGYNGTLKTRSMAVLPVGIAGVNGVLRVHDVPGRSPLLLSKEFLKDLCCHVDLGRGHLLFEKLGVRTVVTGKQSPHLLLPLTSVGQKGHDIPAEIQPRIRSGECAIYRAICGSSKQGKTHVDRFNTDHRPPETDNIDTEYPRSTDGQGQNPCDQAREYKQHRKRRWVRVHVIVRQNLFDPMHDEQPFCQNFTESRRTIVRILGQQSEMTFDETWSQMGEMRSLWKGTTELWIRDCQQNDT